jgi:GGDEF domain-containing protein
MPPVPPRRRRARPVSDAPIDSLLLRSEDLTKGWLLALLEDAPLHEAPGILGADLTRDGPRLCDAVVRAIADDTDLRRLEPGGALRPMAARAGELAGAATSVAVSRAVDALQAAIWSAMLDELRRPDADLMSALTERLMLVAGLLRAAALERGELPPGVAYPSSVLRSAAAPPPGAAPAPAAAPPPSPSAPLRPGRPPVVPPTPPYVPAPPAAPPAAARSSPADVPPAFDPPEALWIEGLKDEIRRSGGTALSLLLAELEDADRVTAVHTRPEATATLQRFSGAVRSAVRRQDILVCESDARAWIIARGTSRREAYALGERIADAVSGSPAWQGVPLAASVGVAVLGEDGRTSAQLMEAAEERRFAAAASGVDVLRAEPELGA